MATVEVLPPDLEESFRRLKEAFGDPSKIEPLHPDLEAMLEDRPKLGRCIRHPLVYSMLHHPAMNGQVNLMYAQKQKMLDDYLRRRQWFGVLMCHERPYRLEAFQEYIGPYVGPITWWRLLGGMWTDSENIHQGYDEWLELLREGPADFRWAFMDKDDRAKLRAWQRRTRNDAAVIYRGLGSADHPDGMSWTLSYAKAVWFARRYAGIEGHDTPTVLTAIVRYRDVLGYFTQRGEDEFVVLPEHVEITGAIRL